MQHHTLLDIQLSGFLKSWLNRLIGAEYTSRSAAWKPWWVFCCPRIYAKEKSKGKSCSPWFAIHALFFFVLSFFLGGGKCLLKVCLDFCSHFVVLDLSSDTSNVKKMMLKNLMSLNSHFFQDHSANLFVQKKKRNNKMLCSSWNRPGLRWECRTHQSCSLGVCLPYIYMFLKQGGVVFQKSVCRSILVIRRQLLVNCSKHNEKIHGTDSSPTSKFCWREKKPHGPSDSCQRNIILGKIRVPRI